MAEDHVTVARFRSTAEAAPVVARLEEEGVRAMLVGDLASGVVTGLFDPRGGVQLQVAVEDEERAKSLLDEVRAHALQDEKEADLPHTEAGRPGWICTECRTVVDLEMEVCPSCGRAMDVSEEPDSLTFEALAKHEEVDLSEGKEDLKTWVADKLAERALKAAVMGLFLLPPLLHLYSISVLLQLRQAGGELSEGGRGKANLAWTINVVVVGVASLIVISSLLTWNLL